MCNVLLPDWCLTLTCGYGTGPGIALEGPYVKLHDKVKGNLLCIGSSKQSQISCNTCRALQVTARPRHLTYAFAAIIRGLCQGTFMSFRGVQQPLTITLFTGNRRYRSWCCNARFRVS